MHLQVMGLGSSFQTSAIQCSSSDSMSGCKASDKNYRLKTALNEEIAVHEWQQKVKHVMKELNSQC